MYRPLQYKRLEVAQQRNNISFLKCHGDKMRANEFTTETIRQRLDPKCWKGKHKEGTKIKGGVRVNNCVPNSTP